MVWECQIFIFDKKKQGPSGTNHGLGVNLENNGQNSQNSQKQSTTVKKCPYGQKRSKTVTNGQNNQKWSKTVNNGQKH